MAKRPAKTAADPVDMGMVRSVLPQPERVADLSVADATELKERRRLMEKYERDAADAAKTHALLRSEYLKYAEALILQKGLDTSDDHNIDTEGGAIWRTATYVPVTPEVSEVIEDEPPREQAD